MDNSVPASYSISPDFLNTSRLRGKTHIKSTGHNASGGFINCNYFREQIVIYAEVL
jgi:hypothetical protein